MYVLLRKEGRVGWYRRMDRIEEEHTFVGFPGFSLFLFCRCNVLLIGE